MSQARFLAGASGRVLERSASASRFRSSQRRYLDAGLSSLKRSGGQTSLPGYHVANPTLLVSINFARTLSTNTPQTSRTTKNSEPPPPSVPSKKAKVELRPGPTKTSSNAAKKASIKSTSHPQPVQAQPPLDTKPRTTKPPPILDPSPKKEPLKESETKRVIDVAKKDLDDAARHGILKPPPADASTIGRLFHQAKELFFFYVAGLKYIYVHRKEVRSIQERVRSGGLPLTWKEHRFILTNRSDMIKLVPFLMVIIVIEELIPLIVMYVPGMLPSTCVLPSQRERIEAKRRSKQSEAYALAKASDAFKDVPIEQLQLKYLDSTDIGLLCNTIGASSWGLSSMQRRRLKSYLRKLSVEDKLLLAEGKGARLNQTEIVAALCDRGFLADTYTPVQQRERLRWWLENVSASTSKSHKTPEDVRLELLVQMLREAYP